jgi:hypothetical protein
MKRVAFGAQSPSRIQDTIVNDGPSFSERPSTPQGLRDNDTPFAYMQQSGRPRMPSVAYTATPIVETSRAANLHEATREAAFLHMKEEVTPSYVHREKDNGYSRVSHIYCRMCRRDPARQPTATMCGHIFCYGCVQMNPANLRRYLMSLSVTSCISDQVIRSCQCPACEAPLALYSLIKLQVV